MRASLATAPERLRVLLVEDSRMFTSALKYRFETDLGVDVVTCSSLAEMRQAAAGADHGFFVAVTDLNLPDSPHCEALDYALEIDLPTIVFTGKFDFNTRKSILKKNVLDYVIKDNDRAFDEIVMAVGRIISNRDFRILVVDDTKTQRSILSSMLTAQKFEIVEAASGQEALEAIEAHPDISLVLTDYHMGDMDGYQLTRKLRRKYSDDVLRIIGISNSNDPELSASFLKAGASDFLYRPFVQEEFQCRIAQNIGILVKMEALKKAASLLPIVAASA
ncbi:MAG: response regulator [Hoeflea sp.]|uniref:response regulator n=1 Tax=Hoeflea sp. TaxID=1940281 RepID=UPI001E133E2A|nr:response regulator [Hoeflea sp.]MBU4531037.1 response regulator [Alphaproteobacteria bacterium]MBU4542812.1 response regulator [Alphaproteobacteria bacterium]MBU4552624.1 response regulator [Alphaproteobacteria bacterium]MBV1722929.1 response regulator [Hoeflea sp.]MBV1762840.1 response regulator [Hoeflea sp.]